MSYPPWYTQRMNIKNDMKNNNIILDPSNKFKAGVIALQMLEQIKASKSPLETQEIIGKANKEIEKLNG